jgi:uncharacterized membrane protein YjjB (DUF3815 family)
MRLALMLFVSLLIAKVGYVIYTWAPAEWRYTFAYLVGAIGLAVCNIISRRI